MGFEGVVTGCAARLGASAAGVFGRAGGQGVDGCARVTVGCVVV